MKRFIKQISIVAALTIWAGSVSAADDAPGEEDIAKSIGLWLPSYLSIERIDILATVNDGDGINPKFRQRFVAEVVPREISVFRTNSKFRFEAVHHVDRNANSPATA